MRVDGRAVELPPQRQIESEALAPCANMPTELVRWACGLLAFD
jgi:hypothetical protein